MDFYFFGGKNLKKYSECVNVLKDANYMSSDEIEKLAFDIVSETTDWLLMKLREKPKNVTFDVLIMTFLFEERHYLHDVLVAGFGHTDEELTGECMGVFYEHPQLTHECFAENRENIIWAIIKTFKYNGYFVERSKERPDTIFVRFDAESK